MSSSMLRLNRLTARLSCERCGHRLGDPVPIAPAEEDIRAHIEDLMDRIRSSFRTQAERIPAGERTFREWALLSEGSDFEELTTRELIAWLQARLDEPAQDRAGDSE